MQEEEVLKDFIDNGAIGDRRQEIVFIGQNVRKEALCSALDNCLYESVSQARQFMPVRMPQPIGLLLHMIQTAKTFLKLVP